jgi:hypothetical protein
LEQRKAVYEAARNEHPERWSGDTRNVDFPGNLVIFPC